MGNANVDYGTRLARLQTIAGNAGVDALILVASTNMVYATGAHFHLSERPVLGIYPPTGTPAFVIPQLELTKLSVNPPYPIQFFAYNDVEGVEPAVQRACEALHLAGEGKRLGVEGLKMRVLEGHLLERFAPRAKVIAIDGPLAALRLHKDAAEVAAMKRAIAASQEALEQVIDEVRPGMTERQIVGLLRMALSSAGGGEDAFTPIVLAGSRSAEPHGVPGDVAVNSGDLLLFDFGTNLDGYNSDITRTFAVGPIRDELKRIYAVVQAANEAGIGAAKPGVAAQDVDRAARKVIEDAGYGPYFTHRTGHGLGMDVHEDPYMREGNTQILEPGMVFTVEPGIYVPGVGGVRIEDNVLITPSGAEVLTTFPRDLRIIGQ